MTCRLVVAIVSLLLGVTPSLALACDARCLGGNAAHTGQAGQAGHAHAGHPSSDQRSTTHAHHSSATQPSDAASQVHVTPPVTDAEPMNHGCMAAFDQGPLDRQPVAGGLGDPPAGLAMAYLPPSAVRPARQTQHTPPGSRPGRASNPLRI